MGKTKNLNTKKNKKEKGAFKKSNFQMTEYQRDREKERAKKKKSGTNGLML